MIGMPACKFQIEEPINQLGLRKGLAHPDPYSSFLMPREAGFVGLGVLSLLVGILIVGSILLAHGYFAFVRLTEPPPGHGLALPEAPLPDDHVLATFVALAEPIHKNLHEVLKKDDCLGNSRLGSPCRALLAKEAPRLDAINAWLSSPPADKLARPVNLGRHSRLPLVISFREEIPDLLAFQTLAKLLAIRARQAVETGDYGAAEQDLRTIFSTGSFLQQNAPYPMAQTIGYSIHKIGLRAIVAHVQPEAIGETFHLMLPDVESQIDGMRTAMGGEWLSYQDAVKTYGSSEVSWLYKLMGLYNEDQTLRLVALGFLAPLSHLNSARRGTAFADPDPPFQRKCDNKRWTIEWVLNVMGRVFACIAVPKWTEYNAHTAQAVDMVEATRVVVVARRFRREHGRWPQAETEVVPTYLKTWPTSALDAEPLRWLPDKDGVSVLDTDGRTPCKDGESCRFLFQPFRTLLKPKT